MTKIAWAIAALGFVSAIQAQDAAKQPPRRIPRPGVATPGVQRPMSEITPTAVFPIEGAPDWQVITADAVWVSNAPKNSIHRLDPNTNRVVAAIEVGKKPCSGLAAGFGSIWVPNCGDKTLSRVDIATNKVVATIPVGPANSEGGIDVSPDAVWMLTDIKGTLARIDPKTNTVAAEIVVAPGSVACVYGDGAMWISSPDKSVVTRVDTKTNQVTATIEVGPKPRFLTFGARSVWTLNQGDGTVSRIDAKTAKLVATIEVGVPGGGGEIAFGFGHVWATVFEIPISEIDPATNQVVRQWKGPGGDSIRIGHGSLWLSNLREQNLWRIDLKDAPDGESGTLPAAWITGGPRCMEVPDWQVHEYNANFYILRESGCIHYEKPFLYLIFGADRALLVDTGAGTADTAAFVQNLIGKWLERNHRASIPLLVVHSHGHGDHTAGDQKLAALAGTTVIPATPEAAHKAFAIENWPEQIGQIDLGGRVLDVIPIPGHQAAQVAYYDRKTGVLLTGDHLYPGRLYVADFAAYTASTRRLVHFTEDHPVTHILGAHIEQTSAPFTDYPVGRMYQPREHVLELGRAQLLELMAGLEKMNGKPARVRFRDFTIWPNETRTREETEAARKAAEEERANKWNQPKQP